jgi:hypothetical protein
MIWIPVAVGSTTALNGRADQEHLRHNARRLTKNVKGRESSPTDDSFTIPTQAQQIDQGPTILTPVQLIDESRILTPGH